MKKIENLKRKLSNCRSTQPGNGFEIDYTRKQINDLNMALNALKKQTNELAMFQMESRTKIQETEMENRSAFIQQHSINRICDKLQLRQRK